MSAHRVAVAATTLVAVAAGVLAAVATHDVAVETGAVSVAQLGWLLPVIVEGGAVVAAVLAWRRAEVGERAWCERLALAALLGLAVAVNASHASGDHPLGVVLAAAPPVVLIVSVELLLRARREHSADGDGEDTPISAFASKPSRTRRVPAEARPSRSRPAQSGAPSDRDAVVTQMLDDDPSVTGVQVAERLGCSPATGRRLLAAARSRREIGNAEVGPAG